MDQRIGFYQSMCVVHVCSIRSYLVGPFLLLKNLSIARSYEKGHIGGKVPFYVLLHLSLPLKLAMVYSLHVSTKYSRECSTV